VTRDRHHKGEYGARRSGCRNGGHDHPSLMIQVEEEREMKKQPRYNEFVFMTQDGYHHETWEHPVTKKTAIKTVQEPDEKKVRVVLSWKWK
jgi:hypothetical protein